MRKNHHQKRIVFRAANVTKSPELELEDAREASEFREKFFQVGFQFLFTSVFGVISTHLFFRCNFNFFGVLAAHSLCNWFGIPEFHCLKSSDVGRLERFGFGILYVLGLVGFLWSSWDEGGGGTYLAKGDEPMDYNSAKQKDL